MMPAATENTMAAEIIVLRGAENVETPAPLHPPSDLPFRAALTGALRLCWRRVRGTVEAFGWIVAVVSIIVAVR